MATFLPSLISGAFFPINFLKEIDSANNAVRIFPLASGSGGNPCTDGNQYHIAVFFGFLQRKCLGQLWCSEFDFYAQSFLDEFSEFLCPALLPWEDGTVGFRSEAFHHHTAFARTR
jgi:hypothetical protein